MRGVVLLSVIIVLIISYRIILATKNNKFAYKIEKTEQPLIVDNTITNSNSEENLVKTHVSLKVFDPNKLDSQGLLDLGIEKHIVRNIIKYRQKGGIFREPSDILKIYGVDSLLFWKLLPYISIQSDNRSDKHTTALYVELNTADTSELKKLPGIGTTLSGRIVKYRNLLGGFYSSYQLKEVYGINDSLFNNISGLVYTDTSKIMHINLNIVNYDELERHPYINNYQAKAIISYKKLVGQFRSKKQLLENYILSEETYSKLAPYLSLN